jgi:hypothetical protein
MQVSRPDCETAESMVSPSVRMRAIPIEDRLAALWCAIRSARTVKAYDLDLDVGGRRARCGVDSARGCRAAAYGLGGGGHGVLSRRPGPRTRPEAGDRIPALADLAWRDLEPHPADRPVVRLGRIRRRARDRDRARRDGHRHLCPRDVRAVRERRCAAVRAAGPRPGALAAHHDRVVPPPASASRTTSGRPKQVRKPLASREAAPRSV